MSAHTLPPISVRRLAGVHADLRRLVEYAITITPVGFIVTEGLRTLERQQTLLASGATRTLRSRHLTGHAVDLAALIDDEVRWDWPLYHQLAAAMDQASVHLDIPIEWGGRWRKFPDGPHFQLPWDAYPAQGA